MGRCWGVLALLAVSGSWARSAHAQDVVPPGIVHEPCEFYAKGKDFKVIARFYDESAIFDPKVIYRTKSRKWRSAPFDKVPGSPDFSAVLKKRALKGVLEYFIEAFDENGNGPARFGSPEAPLRVRPSKKPPECIQIPEEAEGPTMASPNEPLGGIATSDAGGKGGGKSGGGGSGSADAPAGSDASGGGSSSTSAGGASSVSSTNDGPIVATTEEARPSEVIRIDEPPPPAAKQGCQADDPPLYCSAILWSVVGGVVVAGAAAGVGIYFATTPTGGGPNGTPGVPSEITIRISSPDPTSALP